MKYVRVVERFGMPLEWALSKVATFFKEKGGIRNCSCHRAVKPLEHGMNVVKRVF